WPGAEDSQLADGAVSENHRTALRCRVSTRAQVLLRWCLPTRDSQREAELDEGLGPFKARRRILDDPERLLEQRDPTRSGRQRRLRAQGDAQLAGVVPLTRELELLIGEHMGLLVLSESRVGGSRNCSPWRGRVAPSRQLLHRRSHCER